jgi:OmpA-OmpF porin, OOP family
MYRIASLTTLLLIGCVKPWPTVEPLALAPITTASGEVRVVDHVILIVDASGTMTEEALIPEARAITRTLVAGMPELSVPSKGAPEYKASVIGFGGGERIANPHEVFDRPTLDGTAAKIRPLGAPPTTPLDAAIGEAATSLEGQRGAAALVIIGDGIASSPADAVEATRSLVAGYPDAVCIHTVHTGEDAEGRALLEQLAGLSKGRCGSFRRAGAVRDLASAERFDREIFLGEGDLPPVAAKAEPSACEGRIVLRGVTFQLDRAELRDESKPVLDFAAEQLRDCADRKIVVEGHTCNIGSDGYNDDLSQRRAASVREYLLEQGVAPAQLSTKGLGETQPTATNDTEDGRSQNRRVELVPVE